MGILMCNSGSRLKVEGIIQEERKGKHLKRQISQNHEMITLRVVKSRVWVTIPGGESVRKKDMLKAKVHVGN